MLFHYKGSLIVGLWNNDKQAYIYVAYCNGWECPNLETFSLAKGWIDYLKG